MKKYMTFEQFQATRKFDDLMQWFVYDNNYEISLDEDGSFFWQIEMFEGAESLDDHTEIRTRDLADLEKQLHNFAAQRHHEDEGGKTSTRIHTNN